MDARLSAIKPKTLDGIKQLAKKLKKACGCSHTEGLEMAARQAGFENYTHARKQLEDKDGNP